MTTTGAERSRIALPSDPAFVSATSVFNLAAPVSPAAAVTAHTVADVRAAIRYARSTGMPVRVHTTGHASANARPMSDALLIRTRLTGGVRIDPARRTARIAAGTTWGEVVDAVAAHGLAAAHGSSPLVGVVGYLLRGGVSFYGRQVGLAANSVRAIELVTADGDVHRVDASADQELFWALRGGGGGFGVVTAVEIDLFAASAVITGAAYWPAAHAERLLSTWSRWATDAPTEATTTLRVMRLPDLPEVPSVLSAGPVVCVDGVVFSPAGDMRSAQRHADDLLGPLLAVGEPVLNTWHTGPPTDVVRTHMDPTEPFPVFGDHMLLNDLGDAGAAEFLRLAGERSTSPLTNAELRQLGGALSTPDRAGGVLNHLAARFAYLGGGVPFGPVTSESIVDYCARVRVALTPWDTGRTAPTFVENLAQPQGHLSPGQLDAVDRIRAGVDPAGVFSGDISVNTERTPR